MTFGELLREERDRTDELTHKLIGFCCGVGESQAAEIINHDAWQPRIEQLRHLMLSQLGRLFIAALTCGTTIDITVGVKRDLDLNGDGVRNLGDAMHGINELGGDCGDVQSILLAKGPGGKLSASERSKLKSFEQRMTAMLESVRAVLDRETLASSDRGQR